jgi:hypothetical protein
MTRLASGVAPFAVAGALAFGPGAAPGAAQEPPSAPAPTKSVRGTLLSVARRSTPC